MRGEIQSTSFRALLALLACALSSPIAGKSPHHSLPLFIPSTRPLPSLVHPSGLWPIRKPLEMKRTRCSMTPEDLSWSELEGGIDVFGSPAGGGEGGGGEDSTGADGLLQGSLIGSVYAYSLPLQLRNLPIDAASFPMNDCRALQRNCDSRHAVACGQCACPSFCECGEILLRVCICAVDGIAALP